ncbi:hotdog domain-containing protein [Bacillus sp. FJAT-53060]|uniref:hotdog domain-containing protein n=1 Tax=Bacillus TaxID=1386 RepID=UPI001CFC4299|nr:hotdog domain-containing protein [Bacillus stratosphericus]
MVQPGDQFQTSRTYTHEDVIQFGRLTGDLGKHHMELDDQGRRMVHGFLTASLTTRLGGQFHFIGQDMSCTFIRPVYTGDTITCQIAVTKVEPLEQYDRVQLFSRYINQHGKEVITGKSEGVILK